MGKSKGGGEETAKQSTTSVLKLLQASLESEEREPSMIKIQRVTEGLFAVEIVVHGEHEPEAYFLSIGHPDPPANTRLRN